MAGRGKQHTSLPRTFTIPGYRFTSRECAQPLTRMSYRSTCILKSPRIWTKRIWIVAKIGESQCLWWFKPWYRLSSWVYSRIIRLLARIGIKREGFSVAFSLSDVSEIAQFVAKEKELAEIHSKLNGDGSYRTVVLHELGGMGKT